MMGKLVDAAANRKLVLIILILVATDLSVLLNIPLLRQIFGFIFLTFIPGFLILYLLKLNKLDLTTKFVLSVGCSVSFLMLFGLLINNLSLILGYGTPLSTVPLLITFNLGLIILATIGCRFNKDLVLSLPKINLSTTEKAFLVVPILFPALSIFGMHIMNTTDNNIIIIFLLFLIPIYVAFVCFFNQRFPKRLYPVVIFLISISVLLLMSLRSNHIMGMDAHHEYYIFQLTAAGQHWQIFEKSTLDACLSISLLPAIYQSVLSIDAEYLFKVLFSLLFSISPLIVYIISKKYIGSFYAFLASFFFMSVNGFAITPLWARSNMAILFFGLAIMVIFHREINDFSKRFLLITFMASIIVSHYSTTYVSFFILLATTMGMQVMLTFTSYQGRTAAPSKVSAREGNPAASCRFKMIITISIVILFFVMLFFWYGQIVEAAFNTGVYFLTETFTQLHDFFVIESRGATVEEAFGISETLHTIPVKIKFVTSWATIAFIAIGVLTTLKRFRERVLLGSGHEKSKPTKKIDAEYFVLSVVCCIMLVISVVFPYITIGYGMDRQYLQAIVPLSFFLVIGGMEIAKYVRLKPCWILIIVLIPYFLGTCGPLDQGFGIPGAVTLNSEGTLYNSWFIGDRESYGAKWLGDNRGGNMWINTDFTTSRRFWSQAGIRYRINELSLFDEDKEIQGYIFLRSYNVIDGKLMDGSYKGRDIAEYQDKFSGKANIYNNGGSEVWI